MAEAVLPKGRIVEATFRFVLPATATPDQVEEWAVFNLRGGTLADSPLSEIDLEASGAVYLRDTGIDSERTG